MECNGIRNFSYKFFICFLDFNLKYKAKKGRNMSLALFDLNILNDTFFINDRIQLKMLFTYYV